MLHLFSGLTCCHFIFFCREYICSGFPKGNEWGIDYWLACCLEGKHTLNVSPTDFEGIHFSIGSMVIKGEYLRLDERTQKKKGYVFED